MPRLETRQPAAYITRESWFCGLRFYVDERVLVPRSPIAELIANHFEPWVDSHRVNRILDLCCGSGCIGIAAQYQFPDAEVCLSDLSADALEVAALNLQQHDLSDVIELYQSDLFARIPGKVSILSSAILPMWMPRTWPRSATSIAPSQRSASLPAMTAWQLVERILDAAVRLSQ